jgi:hypothetical protein
VDGVGLSIVARQGNLTRAPLNAVLIGEQQLPFLAEAVNVLLIDPLGAYLLQRVLRTRSGIIDEVADALAGGGVGVYGEAVLEV